MKNILIAFSILFLAACSTSPVLERKVSSTEGASVLELKTNWDMLPSTTYTIKGDKLAPSELPNGLVCYVVAKSAKPLSFFKGDRVPVQGMARDEDHNRTTLMTEHFNLKCTQSIVAFNRAVSLGQIKKETAQFLTVE